MNQQLKKKFIASLLCVCCLAAGWAFLTASTAAKKRLKGVQQIDALIVDALHKYGFTRKEIDKYKVSVDSTFQRKVFLVTVRENFPETRLHVTLKQAFEGYNIWLPARVLFPEKDLHIYLSYKGTILRTIIVDIEKPDESSGGSLAITFDYYYARFI